MKGPGLLDWVAPRPDSLLLILFHFISARDIHDQEDKFVEYEIENYLIIFGFVFEELEPCW